MRATKRHWHQKHAVKGEHLQSGLCRTPVKIFPDEGCPAFFHELLDQDSAYSMQEICCIHRVFNKTACKSLQRRPCLDSRNRELLRLKFPVPSAIVGSWIFSEDSYLESSVPSYHYWNTLEVWTCRAFWKMLKPLGCVFEGHCHSLVTSFLHLLRESGDAGNSPQTWTNEVHLTETFTLWAQFTFFLCELIISDILLQW